MSSDNIKNLKNKKIVIVFASLVVLAIIALYAWVGSYVMRVFPREDSQAPTAFNNEYEQSKNVDTNRETSHTLGSMAEKENPAAPPSQPSAQPNQEKSPNYHSETQGRSEDHTKKHLLNIKSLRF